MKKPTQDLGEEHGGIMLMLKILEKIAHTLYQGKNVDKNHLDKIVEFLRNFADKCHHGKEEDILFPEMLKKPSNTKLVNELLGEHKTGRDYIKGIAESLANYQPGNADAYHIAVNAKGYISLLTEHIRKENFVLFPIVDKEISPDDQEKMEKQFESFEKNIMGEGLHEKYHRLLKDLQQIYL